MTKALGYSTAVLPWLGQVHPRHTAPAGAQQQLVSSKNHTTSASE